MGAGAPDERALSLPPIPLARPDVGEAEAEAARRVLLSGWLAQGPQVAAFEAEFAAHVGAAQAVAVCNATAALELVLHALGLGPDDEVVTVSHSFIATANAVRRTGALPVFADIESGGFNIDPASVAAAIGPRTRAVLAVHQMGMPCDLTALARISEAHGLPLIEDAACAAGSEVLSDGRWRRIGRPRGLAACFSLHPRKLLTTGEGGMITTADEALAKRLRRLRTHGADLDAAARRHVGVVEERYLEPGFNMRMTDVQAAIGRVQLARLPQMVARRRELARDYAGRLGAAAPDVGLPREPAWARSNWQSFCVTLPEGVGQGAARIALAARGVASRRGIMCAHREPAYPPGTWACAPGRGRCDCAGPRCTRLGRSERAQDRSLLLPLYNQMTEADLDRVTEALVAACRS